MESALLPPGAPGEVPGGATDSADDRVLLIVDDDPDMDLVRKIHVIDGYSFLSCPLGADAYRMAVDHRPAAILLDLVMPDVEGFEVLQSLSSDPATKDIPVIFVSALEALEEATGGLQRGAVDFVSSRADGVEIAARVGAAIARARIGRTRSDGVDGVTALPGPELFEDRLGQEVSRCRRSRAPLSLLLIDVDRMSSINGRHGWMAGDSLLHQLARVVKDTLRTSDVLFRHHNDRFVGLLPDAGSGMARAAADRILTAVTATPDLPVSLSVGIAAFVPTMTPQALVEKAERALVAAKSAGGGISFEADGPFRAPRSTPSGSDELTQREWKVLDHLMSRCTEQEIGRRLGIASGTVRSHKARIRRKLQVPPDTRLIDFLRSDPRLGDRLHRRREEAGDR